MPHIVQISVNPKGGVPKNRVEQALLKSEGVEGDKQRDKRFHGGPERAVCMFSYERIQELQAEGHPIDCGTTGENLTVAGLNWDEIIPGVRLQINDIALEIVSYTSPCYKIAASFTDGEFVRISQKVHPGWSRVYARVLQEGVVREGDEVELKNAD
jgi:MOSC domain-containing protein YiiM